LEKLQATYNLLEDYKDWLKLETDEVKEMIEVKGQETLVLSQCDAPIE